jgi:hypothetical protein
MNLRDQLKEVLPEILPRNPAEAIKGTELIRLVKYRLRHEYTDATLRYHFSILCCDPASPIAKVDQGQGYYLRQNRMATMGDSRTLAAAGLRAGDLFQGGREAVDLALSRVAKFRALFARLVQADARFAFGLSSGPSPESLWKFPDFAVVDWEADESVEHAFVVSRELLDLKTRLGVQPFRIAGVKLALIVTYDNVREVFFQALSASRWAHTGELVIGAGIADEQLVEELRRLGAEYGIGVSTLGCKPDSLDDIADAAAIRRLDDRAFESLQTRLLARQKITSARPCQAINWRTVNEMRRDHSDFRECLEWIEQCIRDGQVRGRPTSLAGSIGRVAGL